MVIINIASCLAMVFIPLLLDDDVLNYYFAVAFFGCCIWWCLLRIMLAAHDRFHFGFTIENSTLKDYWFTLCHTT